MSNKRVDDGFLTTEDCILTLNYAWYHTIGCSLLLAYLYSIGRTHHFEAGHNFGIFAMVADYGYMYLAKGTRTLRVLPYNDGVDTDELYGIGTFLFFGWFDYLGGFALLVFARNVSDAIANGRMTKTNAVVVLQHVLMWWTAPFLTVPNDNNNNSSAPLLPPWARIDDRTLVLSRSSPKWTYLILFVVFTALLFKTTATTPNKSTTTRQYLGILVSGLACGSLHHLALFVFGMRGYDSYLALAVTIATEWPALLCGEAFVRKKFSGYSTIGRNFLLAVLLAIMTRNLPNVEQITEFVISVIPGHHMQTVGTAMLWTKTCVVAPQIFRRQQQTQPQCTAAEHDDDDAIWVISTPAKSGAVLSAKILLDIASECNFCVASGTRVSAGIPGPGTNIPTYKGKLLHALMDMDDWPRYVETYSATNTSKCVSMTRDPLNRLRSFYTYSRSGGEHWVRYETDLMDSLRNAGTLEESVRLFWERVGKTYLVSSHRSYLLDDERGCYRIEFEDFANDYETTIRRILRVFGIAASSASEDRLVRTLARHDRSKKNTTTAREERVLAKDPHVSSKKFSREFLKEVERIFLEDIEEAGSMIRSMRVEMESLTAAPPLLSSSSSSPSRA